MVIHSSTCASNGPSSQIVMASSQELCVGSRVSITVFRDSHLLARIPAIVVRVGLTLEDWIHSTNHQFQREPTDDDIRLAAVLGHFYEVVTD